MEPQTRAEDPPWRPSAPPVQDRALVIDLEDALLRSSLLLEAVFGNPGRWLACLRGLALHGMKGLEQVLDTADIGYAHLPYEPDVLNLSLAARAQGREIYISTGRFPNHAAAIAAHLGFDGIVDLTNASKEDAAINSRKPVLAFDAGTFEYDGRDRAPEGVWRAPSAASVVGRPDRLLQAPQGAKYLAQAHRQPRCCLAHLAQCTAGPPIRKKYPGLRARSDVARNEHANVGKRISGISGFFGLRVQRLSPERSFRPC